MNDQHLLYLRCLQGKERGQRFALTPGESYRLGRDPGVPGIIITDLLASRTHAEIRVADDHVVVNDSGSANGTKINGRSCDPDHHIYAGDIIAIGHTSLVLEDPRVQSSGDHLPESTRTHRKRQSQRLKRQLQRNKTVNLTAIEPIDNPVSSTDGAVLTHLLATMPLAMLLTDREGQVLLANSGMRALCNGELSTGQALSRVLERLGTHLLFPEDLETAIGSKDPKPVRLECPRGRDWIVWSISSEELNALYILTSEALGTLRS